MHKFPSPLRPSNGLPFWHLIHSIFNWNLFLPPPFLCWILLLITYRVFMFKTKSYHVVFALFTTISGGLAFNFRFKTNPQVPELIDSIHAPCLEIEILMVNSCEPRWFCSRLTETRVRRKGGVVPSSCTSSDNWRKWYAVNYYSCNYYTCCCRYVIIEQQCHYRMGRTFMSSKGRVGCSVAYHCANRETRKKGHGGIMW